MRKDVIPVLLYHAVNDHPAASSSWGAVSRARFESHVELIARSGRSAMTVTALAAGLRGQRTLPAQPVAITFDDGYLDTYDSVAFLTDRGLAATVFVTTAEIGTPDRLSGAQLADLARAPGVEVGAHAVHHRRLDELDSDDLAYEVGLSKAHLEDLTGQRVDSFSYPHGAYDRRVRDTVVKAGYRAGAAVKNALSHREDDPFAISRWTVDTATSRGRIAEVLEGRNVRSASNRERLRTRAYRTARRQRRRLVGARSTPW